MSQLGKNQYCTVKEWIGRIESNSRQFKTWLVNTYGPEQELHSKKRNALLKILECFGTEFGFDEKVIIVRAPGRINLMGRHVDHRGGYNNFMAPHRETIMVAAVRDDDNVVAVDTHPNKFKQQQFSISKFLGPLAQSSWLDFVNSDWVSDHLKSTAGSWGNYIKAILLRLQHQFADLKIRGMNLALHGDIPMAAGLSSSSSIVVATLKAAIALNEIELTCAQFIELCGEGEWFVGTRGGAGDHAAICLSQRGKIIQVGNLPFHVETVVDAPADYQLIIANSLVKAAKSESARHQFNACVTGYNLGLALLRQRCPRIADKLEHIRDINPKRLGCSGADIYKMLLKVPEQMTRKDFKETLGDEYKEMLEINFSSHDDPRVYNVRGILLFGIAECLRAEMCIEPLQHGDIAQFGRLMQISHNGDRVSRPCRDGTYEPAQVDCSDRALKKLVDEIDEHTDSAELYMQPGSYSCSTEEIDRMVDIACAVEGVVGAQIAGAGLGGCVMILAKRNAVDVVRDALTKQYYNPNNLSPVIINCMTVEGASLADFGIRIKA